MQIVLPCTECREWPVGRLPWVAVVKVDQALITCLAQMEDAIDEYDMDSVQVFNRQDIDILFYTIGVRDDLERQTGEELDDKYLVVDDDLALPETYEIDEKLSFILSMGKAKIASFGGDNEYDEEFMSYGFTLEAMRAIEAQDN